MKLSNYIKDKIVPLAIFVGVILFISLALYAYGMRISVVIGTAFFFMCAVIIAFIWDFLQRRRFYSETLKVIEAESSKTYYLAESLSRPSFFEGAITFDAFVQANKDMNDAIAAYRISSDEYREYIESWVHEVKTPIAAARLILANNDDETTKALEYEIERVESYLEQALYYSRSTAVEKDYQIRAVELSTLVKGVVKKQARALIECNITPVFENLDVVVYSDAKWLDFIVGQIVANAIKYYRPAEGTHQPTIRFCAEQHDVGFENGRVVLRIIDNGIGIAATDIPRIFDKGFTGENGRRYNTRSTGIGLYLCKKLCTKMKLGISATSHEGQTALSIEFPLSKMYFLEQ